MTVINTNVKSLISQNALIRNNRAVETAMEQLSTGKRINSASDDAAGMAISNRMTSQIRGLDQAVRNANDGISLIQTVEGSLNEVNSMLQRMRELSIQSANDTNTDDDRGFLNMEFQQLKQEINRVAKNTQWNGMDVLNKSANAGNGDGKFEFQVGANANQWISIQLEDFRIDAAVLPQPGTPVTTFSEGEANLFTKQTAQPATGPIAQVPAVDAKPQVSTLTLSSAYTYAVGDKIKLEMTFGNVTKDVTYEVTAADITGTPAEVLSKIRSGIVSKADIDKTLEVTLASGATAGTIEFTGLAGVNFTPKVTSTIADAGKAVFANFVAGTPTVRETNSFKLSGNYQEGDVITLSNGKNSIEHIVTISDAGKTNSSQLATNIAAKLNGYLDDTTVDVTGDTLKFTATQYSTPLNLTFSVKYAIDKFATTPAIVGSTGSPSVPATDAVPQVNQLAINGSFDAGDEVKITIDGKDFAYTVSEGDAAGDNPSEAIAKGLALSMLEASPTLGVSVVRTGSNLSFTGNPNGTPFTASTSITRAGVTVTPPEVGGKPAGSLNMIEQSKLTERTDSQSAIESLDDAMAVINESLANMGAVMNRLTFAADNLTNVAQNSTESRSRILDTDFAKASSELARTQIISQAATSVLAQANQSQQSVLKLLQG
jgi:flagellin